MSLRVFAVVAILLLSFMLNGVLIFLEETPQPIEARSEYVVEDQFKDMIWTPSTRRSNMQAFGLPPDVVDEVDERLQAMTKRDRKGRLIEALKANSDVGGRLCSNVGSLPSRYFAMGILFKGEPGMRKSLVRFDTLLQKVSLQEEFRPIDMEGLYQETEMQPNAKPDTFALNVSAVLLGQEVARIEKDEEWAEGIFGPPDIQSYLNRVPEVRDDLIEFYAATHYLHEVARDPKNQFCGVRVGAAP